MVQGRFRSSNIFMMRQKPTLLPYSKSDSAPMFRTPAPKERAPSVSTTSLTLSPWWNDASEPSSKLTTRLIASFAPFGHLGSGYSHA